MEKDPKAILLGKRISELRESKGLSIRKLAKIIEISDTALAKVETGTTTSITIKLGVKIAKALEISFNELFDIENSDNGEYLQAKIEQLEKRIVELEDQLNDKRKLTTLYGDTAEYLQLFLTFASEITDEDANINASDLLKKINERIKLERGQYTFVFTEKGVRIKFLTEEELKMMDIAMRNSGLEKK